MSKRPFPIIAAAVIAITGCGWYAAYKLSDAPLPWIVYGTVVRSTTFYPSTSEGDLDDAATALVKQQFMDRLCGKGIECPGRMMAEAGTRVRILRRITLQNDAINESFVKIRSGNYEGWVLASDVE